MILQKVWRNIFRLAWRLKLLLILLGLRGAEAPLFDGRACVGFVCARLLGPPLYSLPSLPALGVSAFIG